MKKQVLIYTLFFVLLPVLSVVLLVDAQGNVVPAAPGQRYTETIPVIDIRDFGYRPVRIADAEPARFNDRPAAASLSSVEQGGGSDPNNPYAVMRKTGPTYLQPGSAARYEITLTNYESVTHSYRLTDTLPAQLAYVPDSANGLIYNPITRVLTWQGELAPGGLEIVIEEAGVALPYLDLADFGAVNLCDDFITAGEDCDDVAVTFNLGVNGYTANLYGETLTQIILSSNGIALAGDAADSQAQSAHNQWLPDASPPGYLLAGLWRDVDMGSVETAQHGRWHAAIISGLVAGYDVFYAQWHDAPHANNPDLTARHAIAIVLNSDGSPGEQPLTGHVFFIYDNISDPAQLAAQGYTIGVEDKLGERGVTYAYAPCCGDLQPPQGYPPAAGTTLHLRPALFGAATDYSRTFSYEATVNGTVPETIAATAVATSSSRNPALAHVWATHYLYVRWQTYLPLLQANEVAP